jgi:hypothetical protein
MMATDDATAMIAARNAAVGAIGAMAAGHAGDDDGRR